MKKLKREKKLVKSLTYYKIYKGDTLINPKISR